MLVIAHHFVQNSDLFWSTAQKIMAASDIPQNLKLHSVFPSADGKTGTCVWEAQTTREVQDWLDARFGQYAKNVAYEVDEKSAYGLPQKAMTAAAMS